MIEQLIPDELEFTDKSKAEAFAKKVNGKVLTKTSYKLKGSYDDYVEQITITYIVEINK